MLGTDLYLGEEDQRDWEEVESWPCRRSQGGAEGVFPCCLALGFLSTRPTTEASDSHRVVGKLGIGVVPGKPGRLLCRPLSPGSMIPAFCLVS